VAEGVRGLDLVGLLGRLGDLPVGHADAVFPHHVDTNVLVDVQASHLALWCMRGLGEGEGERGGMAGGGRGGGGGAGERPGAGWLGSEGVRDLGASVWTETQEGPHRVNRRAQRLGGMREARAVGIGAKWGYVSIGNIGM
jgi:hypothetical protein